ncbi:MAG TPA: hypothetical protein VMG55_20925 [Stellaceae bacterium]|nr:hypothetical protein [Stellaceae bacterium]
MRVGTIVVALLAAIALCAVVPAAHAGCTYDQAVQKMTAVANGLGQKLAQAKTPDETQKIQAGYAKLNEGGEALAKQDYDKACTIYDGIAKDLDLKP